VTERPGGEGQDACERLVHFRPHPGEGARVDRLLAGHQAHHIDAVATHIHQAAAGEAFLEPDVVIATGDVEGEGGLDNVDLAHCAFRDHGPDALRLGMEAVHEGLRQQDVVPGESIDHGLRFRCVAGQGLLAQRRFACLGAPDAPGGVLAVGQGVVNGVDVGVGEQLLIGAVGGGNVRLAGKSPGPLQIAAGHRRHDAVARLVDGRDHAVPADVGRAEDAPADFVCHCCLSFPVFGF